MLVLGLGTGRCGTRSLAMFLNKHGVPATHERYGLNWNPNNQKNRDKILRRIKPDVAYYWLNYVDLVLDRNPNTKFICFKREKEKVVGSFLRTTLDPIYRILMKGMGAEIKEYKFKYSETVTQKELDAMDEATREFVELMWDEEQCTGVLIPTDDCSQISTDRRTYLSEYYDEYYIKADSLQTKYPDNFKIFDMLHALNTPDGNQSILDFIGITPNAMVQ